jgi:opacity protein-like surface antigen
MWPAISGNVMRRSYFAILTLLSMPGSAVAAEPPNPPPTSAHFLQYGVAITAETPVSAGDVCPSETSTPCILGSGGGLAVRVGYRARGPWYVGGAYEFSRLDSHNLLRLAILQQLRAETRYYFDRGARLTPYVTAGLGATLYGNEWSSETGGVVGCLGVGLEFQVSQATVVGAAVGYRPFLLRGWTDTVGQRRADQYLGFGFAHFVALELVLEVRDTLERW